MPCQVPGNGALACPGWSVNRNNHHPARIIGANGAFIGAHPRFFVFRPALGLAGAVKPYRFVFPALAPAARAGLRLLREERESGRASFLAVLPLRRRLPPRTEVLVLPAGLAPFRWPLPFPFPFRGASAEADGFPFRTPAEAFGAWFRALPFPLLRVPFVEPETARLPLVGLAPFVPQRELVAGRVPLAERPTAGREDELLVSEPGRRAVRLPVEPVAGLRSREWAAGRLK